MESCDESAVVAVPEGLKGASGCCLLSIADDSGPHSISTRDLEPTAPVMGKGEGMENSSSRRSSMSAVDSQIA